MKRSLVLLSLTALALTACGGPMALIGLDKDGNPVEAFVDEARYTGHVKEMLASTKQSVSPILNNSTTEGNRWGLRSAIVGFGMKGEAGIGTFRVGVKPRFRVVFGKGPNPPIP